LVEQRIENPRVGGSIPPLATKQKEGALRRLFSFGGLAPLSMLVPSLRPGHSQVNAFRACATKNPAQGGVFYSWKLLLSIVSSAANH
jgi:hypothetical protein